MKPKLKKNEKYYLVLHKRDWTHKPAVVVPVKMIKRKDSWDNDWIVVEQDIDGIKHKLTVHRDWLAPYDPEKAKNLFLFTLIQATN